VEIGRGGHRARLTSVALLCGAALVAPASAAGVSVDTARAWSSSGSPTIPSQGPPPQASRTVALSNETTHTTWSEASYRAKIHSLPSSHSRVITRLLIGTPDGLGLQTYLLLSERFARSGSWIRLRVPGRPNGRIGWVQRRALEGFEVVHTEIVVRRAVRRLTLYRNGVAIFRAPVGIGKPSTPTPPGHFWITEAFVSTDPFYGPYAFGTTDYSTLSEWPGGGVVGLHGTDQPRLVPGDPSHGCIRLHNSDILRLKRLVGIGTPVWVR
jgi:L,D-transpeptidase-like protein